MKFRPLLVFVLGLLVSVSLFSTETAAAPAMFKPGDRWVAVGDSITHSGSYHQWVQLYYVTRFPGFALDLVNCGISGDTADAAIKRYGWDIAPNLLSKKGSYASVMLGMNDVTRSLYSADLKDPDVAQKRRERIELHKTRMRELVGRLKKDGARVIIFTPSIFDDTADLERPYQSGVNSALGECAEFDRALAAETGAALVDFYAPMNAINRERQQANHAFTIVGPDRIHPGPPGHLVMAYLFLKAQGVPAEVAKLSLDYEDKKIVSASNGSAKKLSKKVSGKFLFTWTANALPFPIDAEAKPATTWVPFANDLNQEILQVTRLPWRRYLLQIDGIDVRAYSAKELAQGVNLAIESGTPQNRQAAQVMMLVKQRAKLVSEQLRRIAQVEHQSAPDIAHPVTADQMKPYIDKRLEDDSISAATRKILESYAAAKGQEATTRAEIARLEGAIRNAATPVKHEYILIPED
ncbi:MAG TPA: SGNH/GDSL hydrolase family protein [Candidatus Didemnitutus sp.]|nr:SGNH/GDSL hydrolase family protein [Candidatus Didemnitutus sp.]